MKKKEINLPSYEELLGDSGQVKEIPLSELYEFKNHPFKVREDAEFSDLLKSIQEYGVLTPGVARKRNNGGYELISGHRRKAACKKLGLPSMPVIIKDFSDDEVCAAETEADFSWADVFSALETEPSPRPAISGKSTPFLGTKYQKGVGKV